MYISALILAALLGVFSYGRSPVFRVDRTGITLIGAALMIGLGILSFEDAVSKIDMTTIVILFTMMLISASLRLAGFFDYLGQQVRHYVKTKRQLLAAVIGFSGFLSAFFINDVVCLLFTPVVLQLCRQSHSPPLPYLIALATAANIGSAATLIGNPQNILIASLSGLPFLFYLQATVGIVAVSLVMNYGFIRFVYAKSLQGPLTWQDELDRPVHPYLIAKTLAVLFIMVLAFIFGFDRGATALLGAAFLLFTRRIKPNKLYHGVDFNLLVMFMGLFVIMAGVKESGLLSAALTGFDQLINNQEVFIFLTVIMSNLFSNVPAVLLLQNFITDPHDVQSWISLAFFSTIAGNLTLPGSVANLIVAELARKENVILGFWDYFKIGFPLTILVILIGLAWF